MFKRIIFTVLLTVALTGTLVTAAWAAPKVPGPKPSYCRWNDTIYPHNSLHYEPIYYRGTRMVAVWYVYRCEDGHWRYVGLSDYPPP